MLNIHLLCDLVIPLISIYPKEMKNVHTNSYSQMFTEALFIIVQNWKQPNVHQEVNRKTVAYSRSGVLLSNEKDRTTAVHNTDETKNTLSKEDRRESVWFDSIYLKFQNRLNYSIVIIIRQQGTTRTRKLSKVTDVFCILTGVVNLYFSQI